MAGFDKRLIKPVVRSTLVTTAFAVVATAVAVTCATMAGILPWERWLFELLISSGIAMIVSALIAPFVITKFLKIAQELRDAKGALQVQADTDHLTGLLNRRGFEANAERLMKQSESDGVPVAIISVDIDHFKRINDHFGHSAGDVVIKAMATGIKTATRDLPPNTYALARMGGEEFSCIAINLPKRAMMTLAEQMRVTCNDITVVHAGEVIKATMSVGASIMSHRDADLDRLMISADRALYKAKQSGRNRTEYGICEYKNVA